MRKLIVLPCSLLVALTAHATFVWDDFSDGASVLTASTPSWTADYKSASVPGGVRDIENRQLVNLYGLTSTVATVGHAYTMSNSAGVYSASYLVYGYSLTGGSNPFDLNLNSKGNQFTFNFDEIGLGLNFNVIAYSNGGSLYRSYGINLGPGAQQLNIPFSSFSGFGNFDHVSQLVLEFDQSSGVWYGNDIALKNILVTQAVPEPATLAVIGLGAVGLLRRRRNSRA